MKSVIITIFCFVKLSSVAQWSNLNSGTSEFLPSISFVDEDNGYCISESGVLRKTNDGGANWNVVTTINGFKTLFLDVQTGFIYGYNEIYKTTDGGNNWAIKHTINVSQSIGGIYFIDQNTGYAAAANYTDSLIIYKTTDGGENWNYVAADLSNVAWLNVLYFKDANTGFIGNVDGQILRTNDGGLNWFSVHFTTSMVYDIVFENSLTGYAVSEMNFLKTTDGGATWSESTPTFSPLFIALDITPNGTIHLVGGDGFNTGTLIKSTDSGDTWQQSGTNNQSFYDVCFLNDTVGYACGTGGRIVKFSSGSSTIDIFEANFSVLNIFPNPVNGIMNIQFENFIPEYEIILSDISGKTIFKEKNVRRIDVSGFANGVYFVSIPQLSHTEKIQVMR